MNDALKRNLKIILWAFVFVLVFIYFQSKGAYHFFFIEQEHLFLYDSSYICSEFSKVGGFASLLNEYCLQYFVYPYCGALIMSAWFLLIGVLTNLFLSKAFPGKNFFVISILPIIAHIFFLFDENYSYAGVIAFCMMTVALWGFFCLKSDLIRVVYLTISVLLLYWLAGSVAFLFIVCIILWALMTDLKKSYFYLLPLSVALSFVAFSLHKQWFGESRFLLLPDNYYSNLLHPNKIFYLSWICEIIVFAIAFICHKFGNRKSFSYFSIILQLLPIVVCMTYGYKARTKTDFFKELDYYVRHSEWDNILSRCKQERFSNYIYKSMLNLALAEKDRLADEMYSYLQHGAQGLLIGWQSIPYTSTLLSDMYFSMGHIALSQRMAFESNVCYKNSNSRMLMRLVQTNLIYGNYPVAEKYIERLEKSKNYKDWATTQRIFLQNDKAIQEDSLLSIKRNCILKDNILSETMGITYDLLKVSEQNPAHKKTVQYAGELYLLSKEIGLFKTEILEKYFGSEVLPTLPKSFQEAVFIYAEKDENEWRKYNISDDIIRRYSEYRKFYIANKRSPRLQQDMYRLYGNTYWYYFMFIK